MSHRSVARGAWLNLAGFTLLEVLAAMALFGLILGTCGLALASLREPVESAATRELISARDSAIRTGRLLSLTLTDLDTGNNDALRIRHVLFLPDGRVVGTGLDPLTGVPLDNR